MNKTFLALLIILAGVSYGSLIYEPWYSLVQNYLIKFGLIKKPETPTENAEEQKKQELLGNKAQVVLYSLIMVCIGIWIFIKRAS